MSAMPDDAATRPPKIEKILIAVDGSHHAIRATQLAASIAGRFGARVTLLHILLATTPFVKIYGLAERYGIPAETLERLRPLTPPGYEDGIGFPISIMNPPVPSELLVELGRRLLESHKASAEALGAADVSLMMEDGDAAERILDIAARESVDLIVLGHRGLGAVEGLFAGSVSTKVSHLAPMTVIAVK